MKMDDSEHQWKLNTIKSMTWFIFDDKKARKYTGLILLFGGEGGIRTPVGILSQTRFPGVRLKPLIHLSEGREE